MGALFDSHCHLQDPRLAPDLEGVLGRARAAGVTHMVCCGTREEDWGPVLALARGHREVLPMAGLHPWFVDRAAPGWDLRLRAVLTAGGVGLGEFGLDFAPGRPEQGLQEAAFRLQLELARELDLPVSLHCVRAWERFPALLREHGIPAAGAVAHSFSGSAEVAVELQALGLHVSFSAAVARPGSRRGSRAVAAVAPERLLLETDAPDLAPPGDLGDNEPGRLPWIAGEVARMLNRSLEEVAEVTHRNARRVFRRLLP